MRILLLSAYDAASHRHWRELLVTGFPEHQWTVLSLPPRHFSWRIRGNAMSWATAEQKRLQQEFDLLLATSAVDLATLRGLIPTLARVPAVVYFHENQFAYPGNASTEAASEGTGVEPQITSIYTAMAADALAFNSKYNMRSLFAGVDRLLRKMPDHVPTGVVEALSAKSRVLPVPVADESFIPPLRQTGPLTLVWNHRWEYDKGPERFLLVLQQLEKANLDFRVHIMGQQFRRKPPVFEQISREFGHRIGEFGFVKERSRYRDILRRSEIVLSTSLHDFQGLAMLEAMAAGCLPVAPRRLAYPEYIPEPCLADSFADDPAADAASLASRIVALSGQRPLEIDLVKATNGGFSWQSLRAGYARLLEIDV